VVNATAGQKSKRLRKKKAEVKADTLEPTVSVMLVRLGMKWLEGHLMGHRGKGEAESKG
jgi:hypothetical protein